MIAPGGTQRVEWRDDSVYLTGWAEVLFDGEWLRQMPAYRRRRSGDQNSRRSNPEPSPTASAGDSRRTLEVARHRAAQIAR